MNIYKLKIICCLLKSLVTGSKDHKLNREKEMLEQNKKSLNLNDPLYPRKTSLRLISPQGSIWFESSSQR